VGSRIAARIARQRVLTFQLNPLRDESVWMVLARPLRAEIVRLQQGRRHRFG
jgi:hypothetical protein